jgi:PAS domain S-box-containing protein
MNGSREQLEAMYEISLAIGRGTTLRATVERALSAYVEQLDCRGGAVVEHHASDDTYQLVTAMPATPEPGSALSTGIDRLHGLAPDQQFPVRGRSDEGGSYCLMALPSFGALVLAGREGTFDDQLVASLSAVNEKLAENCRGMRSESSLREDRNRFEAVFETIQEPVVHTVFRDGEPIVERVNAAFEETFGFPASQVVGRNINDVIVPDDEQARDEAKSLDEYARDGRTMTREVRRKTADGMGTFLFRGAPIEAGDAHEHVAMYVDVTDEKARQRRLEQLYDETERIFTASNREAVCRRALTAAEELVGDSIVALHLYDRSQEALVPVAVNEKVESELEGEPGPYTDRDTIVWQAYDSDEPVMIGDTASYDGRLPDGSMPVGSLIVLPLGRHGVFMVSSLDPDAFDEVDFDFLRLLATLVETALDRTQRAEGLEEIQAVTRETLEADTHEEVAEAVLSRIPNVLDMPLSAIWEYDTGQEALVPLAVTEKAQLLFEEIPTYTDDGSIAWRAFQDKEIRLVPDLDDHDDVYNEDSIIGSELVVPIGEFGVLISGSTYTDSFGEPERRLLETLSANVETTMRLTSRRRELELLDQVLARILRHNIRNVLTIIQGFAREIQQEGNAEVAANAQRIIDRSASLQSTAEHARDIRHIVTNRDRREELSLPEVVDDIVMQIQSEYPAAHVTTNIEGEPSVLVHPNFPVAIHHLVENGIEHGATDATPRIEISVSQNDDRVVLEVTDNGPGIPDYEVDVLDRHGESALEHGSGAGLWIVDRVVDYSDATLAFERNGDGTVARIEFNT